MVFEAFPLGFPDSITDQALFFRSLRAEIDISFLFITGAEVLMAFGLIIVIIRRISRGLSPLTLGPLFWAVAPYTVMVGYGFVYGIGGLLAFPVMYYSMLLYVFWMVAES